MRRLVPGRAIGVRLKSKAPLSWASAERRDEGKFESLWKQVVLKMGGGLVEAGGPKYGRESIDPRSIGRR
jgi:hypothetical protein